MYNPFKTRLRISNLFNLRNFAAKTVRFNWVKSKMSPAWHGSARRGFTFRCVPKGVVCSRYLFGRCDGFENVFPDIRSRNTTRKRQNATSLHWTCVVNSETRIVYGNELNRVDFAKQSKLSFLQTLFFFFNLKFLPLPKIQLDVSDAHDGSRVRYTLRTFSSERNGFDTYSNIHGNSTGSDNDGKKLEITPSTATVSLSRHSSLDAEVGACIALSKHTNLSDHDYVEFHSFNCFFYIRLSVTGISRIQHVLSGVDLKKNKYSLA